MRIVIDLQGAQSSGSRFRGIGRYSLALSQALVRNKGEHEIIVALNGLFPSTIEPIRAAFDGLLPQKNIRVWNAPGQVSSLNADNNWRRKSAELVREAFLASFKPDVVLVTSLFEGLGDDAVTSIGNLHLNVPTATILYDLIPFIHRNIYLANPVIEAWYETKVDHLRRSDVLLAISESSRQESIQYLGFTEENSVNISTAADPQFQTKPISRKQEEDVRKRYNLKRPYVMYTGGIDHRKNIEGLIRAYAKLQKNIRAKHQLVVVCSIQDPYKIRLKDLANEHGLKDNELVLTGFVPEEDLLVIYNLCKLFVFPSWHEGFGLPALEAMSCGRAVIGTNVSSIPEVIGREDALFAPRSDDAISVKLKEVLTNNSFRHELEEHGLEQAKKFSWDKTAISAIASFDKLHEEVKIRKTQEQLLIKRPKLAYVSPLPSERSGISDYSAELLPELARHYDIDVIVVQDSVSNAWINANCTIRNVEWFRSQANHYERVLYHFGNSSFHQHMFDLLQEIPGVVVLHDFYLSGIVSHMDVLGVSQNGWEKELYEGHGYKALKERYSAENPADIVWKYPCSLGTMRRAQGVIVHSESSKQLVQEWYNPSEADKCSVIPLLRAPVIENDCIKSRKALSLNNDDFLICSYGFLGPTKLNHRLLEAWLTSDLAKDKKCLLIFVGEIHQDEYGKELIKSIQDSGLSRQVRITGWTDAEVYRQYLAAADVAVQLRTLSRGETSAAVLDCMNHGLPTIVNANGSMANLQDGAVWKLSDDFNNVQMTEALETLWRDKNQRERLGKQARGIILKEHAPRACSNKYFTVIEGFYQNIQTGWDALPKAIASLESNPIDSNELLGLAEDISQNTTPSFKQKQLFLDISTLVQHDAGTGIQRVVRSILIELLINPPKGFRVEPVYATMDHGYRYARKFTMRFLQCPTDILFDEPIEYGTEDQFLGLDLLHHHVVIAHKEFYQKMRQQGVVVRFVVYDLLCLLMPHLFNFGEDAGELHSRWLEVVEESDGALCISQAVADELNIWVKEYGTKRPRPFNTLWFHLGADIKNSVPSQGMPDEAESVLKRISEQPSFLMVGTLEPRKGHMQTLTAFEQLWAEGIEVNLVIVGKEGWMVEGLIERMRSHNNYGKSLFWLEGISDEYLDKVYAASTCLVAASVGAGFGLPLIEAAQHKLPMIVRDIPVFREVAGDNAFYFNGQEPEQLADEIKTWLNLYSQGKAPSSTGMPWLTWAESCEQLKKLIV